MPRPETGRDSEILNRPTVRGVLPWAVVGMLLIASVSLLWWAITMREQQRDLVARVQRLQAAAPDRVAPAIVFFGPEITHATLAGPVGRWIVIVVHVNGEAETRLELRSGRVSLWTAREPARRGVVVPAALPASLLPAGEYELVVNDRVHRLTVTAETTSSATSGRSGT
jgi:hypothetical protein